MHSFRSAVEAGNIDTAVSLLRDDVVFRSPIVYPPYHGRAAVAPILHAVFEVFENFRYVRDIASSDMRDHVLVFRARIGEVEIEGSDFLHMDEHGAIDEFVVMVRPLKAAHALADAMKARLMPPSNP